METKPQRTAEEISKQLPGESKEEWHQRLIKEDPYCCDYGRDERGSDWEYAFPIIVPTEESILNERKSSCDIMKKYQIKELQKNKDIIRSVYFETDDNYSKLHFLIELKNKSEENYRTIKNTFEYLKPIYRIYGLKYECSFYDINALELSENINNVKLELLHL